MTPLAFGKFRIFLFQILYFLLFLAAKYGNIRVVKELLIHNANIEARTEGGKTPLIFGTNKNDSHIINYVIFLL
jgi:ankyrin repeat protein